MDVSGGPQAWPGNGNRLPAQGNPGGTSKAQTGALETLESGQHEEP